MGVGSLFGRRPLPCCAGQVIGLMEAAARSLRGGFSDPLRPAAPQSIQIDLSKLEIGGKVRPRPFLLLNPGMETHHTL